jgi:hypothetical protein
MSIHIKHHTYNIELTKKTFENIFYLRNSPVHAAPNEETARLRRAAQARQTTATRVIFLWLRRQRLFAWLACQTSRRLQHEAALAHLQHEQECCARAALAEAQ